MTPRGDRGVWQFQAKRQPSPLWGGSEGGQQYRPPFRGGGCPARRAAAYSARRDQTSGARRRLTCTAAPPRIPSVALPSPLRTMRSTASAFTSSPRPARTKASSARSSSSARVLSGWRRRAATGERRGRRRDAEEKERRTE